MFSSLMAITFCTDHGDLKTMFCGPQIKNVLVFCPIDVLVTTGK